MESAANKKQRLEPTVTPVDSRILKGKETLTPASTGRPAVNYQTPVTVKNLTNYHTSYPETPAAPDQPDHSRIFITDEVFSYRADGSAIIEDSDGSVDESEIDWSQTLATTLPTGQGDAQVLELQPSAPVTDPITELVQAMTPQDEEIVLLYRDYLPFDEEMFANLGCSLLLVPWNDWPIN